MRILLAWKRPSKYYPSALAALTRMAEFPSADYVKTFLSVVQD